MPEPLRTHRRHDRPAAGPGRTAHASLAVAVLLGALVAAGPAGASRAQEAAPGPSEVAPVAVTSWGTAGSGPGQFAGPGSVSVGPDGNVYVSDGFLGATDANRRIQVFDADGTFLRQWGGPSDPFGGSMVLEVAPDGTVYTRDLVGSTTRVQRFDAFGTRLATPPHGFPEDFSSAGNPLVVGGRKVREVDAAGSLLRTFSPPDADYASGVAVAPDGKVYVAYTSTAGASRSAVFSPGGTLIRTIAAQGSVVHPDGWLLGSNATEGVLRHDLSGRFIDRWDAAVATGIDVLPTGDVVFAEFFANRVRVVSPVGPEGWRYKADALISTSGTAGTFAGNNVYNLTATNQAKTANTYACALLGGGALPASFTVEVQNEGNVGDRFTVRAPGTTSRFTVAYREIESGRRVTSQVVAGTYRTPVVPARASFRLGLEVTARGGTPAGTSLTQLATVTSEGDPTRKDAVKYTATYRGRGNC